MAKQGKDRRTQRQKHTAQIQRKTVKVRQAYRSMESKTYTYKYMYRNTLEIKRKTDRQIDGE